MIQTLGSAEITIFGHRTNFQIVSEDFSIPCEGLLGTEYLENKDKYKDRCISETEVFLTESETSNVSNGSNQINEYQNNGSDNDVTDIWEDNLSLANQYHLQFNNQTLMEDLGIAEKLN